MDPKVKTYEISEAIKKKILDRYPPTKNEKEYLWSNKFKTTTISK
jgi:hypothetical protein